MDASTYNSYGREPLGYCTIGSETNADLRATNDCRASSGSVGPRQPASLVVNLIRGAANVANLFTCDRKKLQRPRNARTSEREEGGGADLIACNLSDPGRIPWGVRRYPK